MKKRERDNRRPVVKVVHDIMEQARLARGEGPTSSVYRRETQMSNAISQAGVMLAKMDHGARGRKSSALQNLLGSLSAQPKPKRRSWFFASPGSALMPDAKRIDQLLKAALKDGKPLALDLITADSPVTNDDMICHLPDGAGDPVCEPR
jgi:hypothetical protein